MIRGINSATLDAKGRMALPARLREMFALASDSKAVVTVDVRDSCLLMYPLNEWEVVQQAIEGLSNFDHQVRRLQRMLIGHATDLELDSAGRVLLPSMLREYAQLEKKLVLVGQSNKIEIWSEPVWYASRDEWREEGATALAANAERFEHVKI